MPPAPTPTPEPLRGELFTRIAEADGAAGTLRYRGVSIDDLVGTVSFRQTWGLLVDDDFAAELPPAETFPLPVHTGEIRVDVQSALAQLAPVWGFRQLHDIDDVQAREQLARASAMAMSFVAQSARGTDRPTVPQREIDRSENVVERLLIRWRGDPDPRHVQALEEYFVTAAEHGFNPSTMTARVIASTGADVAACLSGAVGAISGPLHGGAPARVARMLDAVERHGDPDAYMRSLLDDGQRIMGFGHRVYRGDDPRATVLRESCRRLDMPRFEFARAVEVAALGALAERHPDRTLATNMEFWAAVLLDFVEVPTTMFSAMFACARTAGWSAHILEEKRLARMTRPIARYLGPAARRPEEVRGWSGRMEV